MKITVQTEKAPLNPPEGGKLPSEGGVGGGAIMVQDKKNNCPLSIIHCQLKMLSLQIDIFYSGKQPTNHFGNRPRDE